MAENNVRVGNIDNVSGELNIAGRDVVKGFTAQQVSVLLTQITSTFQPKPFDGQCPYKGLDVFEEKDAPLFFGREKLVEDLVSRVKQSRAIFVTGPSGCGKSSLVRAGLIPAYKGGGIDTLHSDDWKYETLKPAPDPLEALALAFSRLKTPELADYFRTHIHGTSILNYCAESVLSERENQRFVLFIDQFEEVFTQITKEEQRQTFFNVLTDALAVENGRVIILFSMRSDFVSNCATYPALNALLNQHAAFAQIGAMQPHELVSAIAQPALRVGLRIDPELIAQIINDMEGEPGTLPLMQFALKDLFNEEQKNGGVIALTLEKYLARGGIHKSLERHADDAFTKLNSNEQELARTIFSSLIEIGRGTPDTSRTALFDELIPATAKAEDVKNIINKLADARLITTDEQAGKDMITISHEKLIDAWPWLRKLVNENRDVIALQNEIAGDAKEWDEHQRDESYLYTGARLVNAQEKLNANKLVLSGLSQAFLDAGIKAHTDELEAAKERAAHLRKRNIYLTIALSTALIAVGVAAYFGLMAFTRQLAAQARVIQDDKRDLAMLMSIQAYKLNDSFETRSSLLSSLQCCSDALISFLPGHEDSVWDVAFNPDGTSLASSGNDGSIRIWDIETRKQIQKLARSSTATVYTVAFSPTNKILAAGDGIGAITLYNTQTWKQIGDPWKGHESSVLSIKFSKDGTLLVSGGTDGKVIVWDVATGTAIQEFSEHVSWVWDVDISADNKTVASVGSTRVATTDATLHLWSLESDSIQKVGIVAGTLVSVSFSDNPRILVTGDASGYVTIWDMAPWRNAYKQPIPSKKQAAGFSTSGLVWGLAVVPGTNVEVVTARDTGYMNRNLIQFNDFSKHVNPLNKAVYNGFTLSRESLGLSGNNFGFFRVDISPDGKYVAAAGQDGLVSLWEASEVSNVVRHPTNVTGMQIINGKSEVAMSVDSDGGVYRWDYRGQQVLAQLALDTKTVVKSAISPDGTKIVTGYDTGAIVLWDIQTGKKLSQSNIHSTKITSLVFNPEGMQLASSDIQGSVNLWNVKADKLEPFKHSSDPHSSSIQTLLFSPDGKTLVGGGCGFPITYPAPECSQGAVFVWDSNLIPRYSPLPGKAGFVWSLAFNPANTNELAVGTRDGTVTIWNLQDRKPRLSFRLGKSDVSAIAFSPNGKLLAVGSEGYKILVFDSLTGQKFGQAFREHDGPVTALMFSPDGNILLSASFNDHTIVIHDLNPSDWQAHACRVANRNLERAEWQIYISKLMPYQEICPERFIKTSDISIVQSP